MAWAVVVFFDEQSERCIRSLWDTLRLNESDAVLYEGASRPHLSLMVLDSQDGTLEEKMTAVARRTLEFTLSFTRLNTFSGSGVLYMQPRPSDALQALYRDAFGGLDTMQERVWPLYLPGKWVPHTTVAMGLEDQLIRKAIEKTSGTFAPFTVRCMTLGVVKFRPVEVTGEYRLKEQPPDPLKSDT